MMSAEGYTVSGGCHCRNISVTMQLSHPLQRYSPRACDCDFCTRHGAAYISDRDGSLSIRVHDEGALGRYKQGDQLAEFILCRNCGVLIGATYRSGARLFGALNANVVGISSGFGERKVASPKQLSASEKAKRWQDLWFPRVIIGGDGA
jgi:hypothetical protein